MAKTNQIQDPLREVYNRTGLGNNNVTYDQFSAKFDSDSTFRRAVYGRSGLEGKVDYDVFEGRLLKKKDNTVPSGQDSGSGLPISGPQSPTSPIDLTPIPGQPTAPGQSNFMMGLGEQSPLIPTPLMSQEGRENYINEQLLPHQSQVQPQQPQQERKGVFADMYNSLASGSAALGEMISGLPEFLYDVVAVPQNLLADMVENNAGPGSADWLRASYSEYENMGPLRAITKTKDYYANLSDEFKNEVTKFDDNIVQSIGNGNFGDAGRQVANAITESVPSIVAMVASGGTATGLGAGQAGMMAASALPFASGEYQKIVDDPNIPETAKPVVAGLKGISEVIFEQGFGTGKLIRDIATKEMGEAATKQFLTGYMERALASNGIPASVAKGGISEGATTLAQNLVEKYSGENPDKDVWEGVPDAIVVGSIMDGGIAGGKQAAKNVVSGMERRKITRISETNDAILTDLSNPDVNMTPEQRQILMDQYDKNSEEIESYLNKESKRRESLTPRQLEIQQQMINRAVALDEVMNNEALSDLTRQEAEAELELAQNRLDRQVEVDEAIVEFQQNNPNVEVDYMEDLPDSVVNTFTRVEEGLPVDPVAVEETSKWMYDKYQELTRLKEDPNRRLTIEQIEGIQNQLGEDIATLENYKLEQYEQAEGETVRPETEASVSPNTEGQTKTIQETAEQVAEPQATDAVSELESSVDAAGQPTQIPSETVQVIDSESPSLASNIYQSSFDRLTEGMTPEQIDSDTDLVRMRDRIGQLSETQPQENVTTTEESVIEPLSESVPTETETGIISQPTQEQKIEDIKSGRLVRFSYSNMNEVPDIFKDRVNRNETNGKVEYYLSLPQSEADYLLSQEETQDAIQIGETAQVPLEERTGDSAQVDEGVREQAPIEQVEQQEIQESEGEVNEVTETTQPETPAATDVEKRTEKSGDKLRELAEKIRQAKISKPDDLRNLKSSTLFDVAWDGAIETAATTLEVAGSIADAVDASIKHLKGTEWYKSLSSESKKVAEKRLAETINPESIESNDVTEARTAGPEPGTSVSTETQDERQVKKRRLTQRYINSKSYSPEFKAALGEDAIHYSVLPNSITKSEAAAIVDIQGEHRAEEAALDMNNGMKSAVRFQVIQDLIDRNEKRGDYEKAGELAEKLVSKSTDYGQGIQILATFLRLSPISSVARAQKNVNKQRDKARAAAKKKIDKINNIIDKINKSVAEQVADQVSAPTNKATTVKPSVDVNVPKGYGNKNKVFTRDRYIKAKNNIRGKAMSSIGGIPIDDLITIAGYHIEATGRDFARFSRRMKADVGDKIKPYLKDIYARTRDAMNSEGLDTSGMLTDTEVDAAILADEGQVWKDKLDKAIKSKSEKGQKVAVARLQEIAKDEGLWGKYRDEASKKLASIPKTNIVSDIKSDPSLKIFTDGLVSNMRQKMSEALPESPARKKPPINDIEVIADAYKNPEKYKDVWERTQQWFKEKYEGYPEVLESLDAYFGEILDTPFSEKHMARAINKGLGEMSTSIKEIIVKHYSVYDATKQSLADKLVNEAGLTGREAADLSKAVSDRFDRMAMDEKKKALDGIFSKKAKRKPEVKEAYDNIIRLTNLGAFSTAELTEMYGDAMGWPKLTEAQKNKILSLAEAVQKAPEGPKRRRAAEDLLGYEADLKGVSAMDVTIATWYANVLSGYNTQIVNILANAVNMSLLYGSAITQRPKDAAFITKGLITGIRRGWFEGRETWRTGYSPIKGKVEIPPLLERHEFKGGKILGVDIDFRNKLKYVRRAMVGADVFFFEGLKEMRAYQMAAKESSRIHEAEPSISKVDAAQKVLASQDWQIQEAKEQAQLEYEQEVSDINSAPGLTEKEKKNKLKTALSDRTRREYDLVEKQRGADLVEETSEYAAVGTYNYPPKGALGAIASGINQIIENVPLLRYMVPFTNIIANVANEVVNYTPAGFIRLKKGGWTNFRREPLTQQQKADMIFKASIGTLSTISFFILSQSMGEDDEPFLEVTSNGTGDWAKNSALKETGWEPYSFRFKLPGGGYSGWISYQYTPLIAALGFVGHIRDMEKYKPNKDKESLYTKASMAAGLTATTFFQTTFIDGIGGTLDALLSDNKSEALVNKTLNTAIGAAKGVMIPNLYTQTAKQMERIFDAPAKEVRETMAGQLIQDIPYARDFYYDKINILGEPVIPDPDRVYSANRYDRLMNLLVDKRAVFGGVSRKSQKIYDMATGEQRMLTDEEFYEFTKHKGQFIKRKLDEGYSDFLSMDEAKFRKELTKIKSDATKSAKRAVSGIDDLDLIIYYKDKSYTMTPETVARRKAVMEEYVSRRKAGMESLMNSYIRKGDSPEEAQSRAENEIYKDARKHSNTVIGNAYGRGEVDLIEK